MCDSHTHDARDLGAAEERHDHVASEIQLPGRQGDLETLAGQVAELQRQVEELQAQAAAEREISGAVSSLGGAVTVAKLAMVLRARSHELLNPDPRRVLRPGAGTRDYHLAVQLNALAGEIEKP